MNKSQSTELFLTQEELQRINYFAKHNQRPSHKSRVNEVYQEEYSFKPQINKKSSHLERTVDDLIRWNERKSQKIQQIYDQESNEMYQNANRLTHELDYKQPSVFERLYVVRKSNETLAQIQQQSSKRNTSDSYPYFTKNMSNGLFTEYRKQQSQQSQISQQQMQTPQRLETDYQESEEQSLSQRSPYLAQKLMSDKFNSNSRYQLAENESLKITTPQHMYVDFTEQIKQIQNEPEPSPVKDPLNKKDVEVMVERLNNWLQKRNQRVLDQQEKQIQSESSQCTFQPKLNRTPRLSQNYVPSLQSHSQGEQSSYANMFQKRNHKFI